MPRSIEASHFLQERFCLPAVAAWHPYVNDQGLIRFRRPRFRSSSRRFVASASRLTPSSTGRRLAKSKFLCTFEGVDHVELLTPYDTDLVSYSCERHA